MALKLKHEPFYNQLSMEQALASGYFIPKHDKINWIEHITLPCTPINFLESSFESENPAIIIATGALCPMHEGHLHMMINAKAAVEEKGYKVIGGYLSPGHDEYIKEKTGDNWMPIHDRLRWANDLIKDQEWLAIDPWEGVFAPGAVNFTSVVYRLQQYIKKFYKHSKKVKIFFVCGADNARFMVPFENTEIGTVIIQRPKYNDIYTTYKKDSDNVIFGYGHIDMSSTEIRKTQKYKNFRSTKIKQVYVRIHWNNIEKNVIVELRKWFSIVWPQDWDEQKRDFKANNRITKPIINLDSETDHGLKLDISRLYDLFGQKKIGYTHRPGTYPLMKQIKNMLLKDYFKECYLFDDDIYTGATMDLVEGLLNERGVKVLGRLSFISGSLKDKEVLDAKDFLIGYCEGGLVSQLDNNSTELIRVPYMYPFVDPSTRASITDPLQFSINMWKLNMDYWKDKEANIETCRQYHFLIKLGFSRQETLYDVSKYYHDFLTKLLPYYTA